MFQSNEDLQKIINRRQRTQISICVIYSDDGGKAEPMSQLGWLLFYMCSGKKLRFIHASISARQVVTVAIGN